PLSSRKTVHKLGLFYYSFGNYSNRSLLRNIHLAAIATSEIIALYKVTTILQYIVDDIKKLESGHEIMLSNGNTISIYGSIAAIAADNPASCSMGGFKESAAAYSGCRHCMATDFALKASKKYGINRYSPLLELKHFDICGGLVPDIMHDVLEGRIPKKNLDNLDLISEHHSNFMTLYPQQSVTPKMHYMVHMPRLIKCYGPLSQLWTMRFEAKHQYFKKLTQRTLNYINLPKTLSERHQFIQIYYLLSPLPAFEIGPVLSS
uniref:Uncharacterized protein n=1 Tax=Amphimedon queenslandica TaxID=400682 RepID=A0A1X7TV16_AMPQE